MIDASDDGVKMAKMFLWLTLAGDLNGYWPVYSFIVNEFEDKNVKT